mmetsp:Transcript_21044/g.45580  ORF Transcript_21044/g.45580 Transcript_21044/m.45580 type:complete len:243 (+) Transcript_21044:503-1231(+)
MSILWLVVEHASWSVDTVELEGARTSHFNLVIRQSTIIARLTVRCTVRPVLRVEHEVAASRAVLRDVVLESLQLLFIDHCTIRLRILQATIHQLVFELLCPILEEIVDPILVFIIHSLLRLGVVDDHLNIAIVVLGDSDDLFADTLGELRIGEGGLRCIMAFVGVESLLPSDIFLRRDDHVLRAEADVLPFHGELAVLHNCAAVDLFNLGRHVFPWDAQVAELFLELLRSRLCQGDEPLLVL